MLISNDPLKSSVKSLKNVSSPYKRPIITVFILMLMGLVMAVTTISDDDITTPEVNGVLYVQAGNSSDLERVLELNTNNIEIIIPKGDYSISSTIQIHNNRHDVIYSFDKGAEITYTAGFDIRGGYNLIFQGGKWDSSGSSTVLFGIRDNLVAQNLKNFVFRDMYIIDSHRIVKATGFANGTVFDGIYFQNNYIEQFTRAVDINTEGNSNSIVKNVVFTNNILHRPNTLSSFDVSALNIGLSTSGNDTGQENIIFDSNIMEGIVGENGVYGVYINRVPTSTNIVITNNIFRNLTYSGTDEIMAVLAKPGNSLIFSNNVCDTIGYYGSGNSESHCIQTSEYPDGAAGGDVIISNNIIKNIFTGATGSNKQDSEGIYCKASRCLVSNNLMTDAGDSRSISMKGSSEDANLGMVTNNIIEYVDRDPLCGIIRIEQPNSTYSGNILKGNVQNTTAFDIGGLEDLGTINVENNKVYQVNTFMNETCGDIETLSQNLIIKNNFVEDTATFVSSSIQDTANFLKYYDNFNTLTSINTSSFTQYSQNNTRYDCVVGNDGTFSCS